MISISCWPCYLPRTGGPGGPLSPLTLPLSPPYINKSTKIYKIHPLRCNAFVLRDSPFFFLFLLRFAPVTWTPTVFYSVESWHDCPRLSITHNLPSIQADNKTATTAEATSIKSPVNGSMAPTTSTSRSLSPSCGSKPTVPRVHLERGIPSAPHFQLQHQSSSQ